MINPPVVWGFLFSLVCALELENQKISLQSYRLCYALELENQKISLQSNRNISNTSYVSLPPVFRKFLAVFFTY